MGYGQKVKKWFFDEDGDEVEEYEDVEIDTEPKTSLFEQAKFSKRNSIYFKSFKAKESCCC